MTAFDRAWAVVKESGPPLNRFDFEGGQESMPVEGWQDFRIPASQAIEGARMSLPPAGNFPDRSAGWYPTTRVVRMPDGKGRITMEPAGSNINLHPLATITHGDMGKNLSGEDEKNIIQDLASTGRHEAIHQAMHPILSEMGHRFTDPDYTRFTEWAANLGQHHDPHRAWDQLMQHSVFRDDDEILDIADEVLSR